MDTLKKWLLINMIFSTISGVMLLIVNEGLQAVMGFKNDVVLPVIGINLLIFAVFILWVRKKETGSSLWVKIISILDGAWVLGSLGLLIFQPFGLTDFAYWLIGGIAILVMLFGVQQYRYVKS